MILCCFFHACRFKQKIIHGRVYIVSIFIFNSTAHIFSLNPFSNARMDRMIFFNQPGKMRFFLSSGNLCPQAMFPFESACVCRCVSRADRGPVAFQTTWFPSAKRANSCRRRWRPLSTTSRTCEHVPPTTAASLIDIDTAKLLH